MVIFMSLLLTALLATVVPGAVIIVLEVTIEI